MTDQSSPPRPRYSGFGVAGRVSVLGALAALFLLFVALVCFGFSGYIMRVGLERELAAKAQGIDALFFAIHHEKNLVQVHQDAVAAALETAKDAGAAEAEARRLDAEYWLKQAELLAEFMPVTLHISRNSARFDGGYANEIKTVLQNTLDFERPQKLTALIAAPVFLADVAPEDLDESIEFFQQKIGRVSAHSQDLEKLTAAGEAARALSEQLKQQLEEANAYRRETADRLKDFRASDVFGERSRVLALEPLFGGAFYFLVQVPTIILTLIVTIAAGGLGSVVSFTRAIIVSSAPASARMLFVAVGEGVAAAVAIFFLAGAGMLMFSTGSTNGGAELSPYMVAFLAFVSGFMAEDAFNSIQRAGRNLFKGGGTPATDTGE